MTDFENRVWDIMTSEDADHVKIEKIRKLYAPKIDPSTCKNDRLYRVSAEGFETIGWRFSDVPYQWFVLWHDGLARWKTDGEVTVLGEYHPNDDYIGRVYAHIEDAVADGMGKYTVLKDRDGFEWIFDSVTTNGTSVTADGQMIKNSYGPFTVLHWVSKEAGE